jgi:hypothetical protein
MRSLSKPIWWRAGRLRWCAFPDGDVLGGYYGSRRDSGLLVPGREILAALDEVRPPQGWIPEVGDTVAVLGNRRRATVVAVILTLPEIVVKVRFPSGSEKKVWLSQAVPVENSKVLVQCERIPRSDTTEPQREPKLF